tara:strand:- start:174 stop:635 length:462 start_codon:yes stop_codon:yes gene_type:complete
MERINHQLEEKLTDFISKLEEDNELKKNYHFNSVINLTIGIIKHNNEEANEMKSLLLKYFNKIQYEKLNKLESIVLFEKYILPLSRFMIKTEKYGTKSNLLIYLSIGLILDVLTWLSNIIGPFLPLFLITFCALGFYSRQQKIKKGKFFAMNW